MCFEFGCFGSGRRQDLGGELPAHKPAHGGGGRDRRGDRGNGAYYGDHRAPTPATYHHLPPPTAVEEAGLKAYHDGGGARKDLHAADAGGHGRYAAYVQDKQADNDTPKLPAWHNKVGDDGPYTYTYRARPHEAAADHRQNAAMDYLHYPTTAANTTTLARY